jgi:hypothetical protein
VATMPSRNPTYVRMRVDISHEQADVLERLVATGLWGMTAQACAEELLRGALREVERVGPIAPRRPAR